MQTLHSKKTRAEVIDALGQVLPLLSGSAADHTGTVAAMLEDLGREALSLIHASFLHKSRGGIDAAGQWWLPLDRKTVAYQRDHPGLSRKKMGQRPRGLLTAKQDARWRQVFAWKWRSLQAQGGGSQTAAGNAAAVAWVVLKAEGARTIWHAYGWRQVDTLVASGALLESLTPGSGHSHQLFEVGSGSVRVGSKLPYADAHHHGIPGRVLPARPLWPEQAPPSWEERLLEVVERWTGVLVHRLAA